MTISSVVGPGPYQMSTALMDVRVEAGLVDPGAGPAVPALGPRVLAIYAAGLIASRAKEARDDSRVSRPHG